MSSISITNCHICFTTVGVIVSVWDIIPNFSSPEAVLQSATYASVFIFLFVAVPAQNYRNNYNNVQLHQIPSSENLSKSPSIYFIMVLFFILYRTYLLFYQLTVKPFLPLN
jgi:hypothetical protein